MLASMFQKHIVTYTETVVSFGKHTNSLNPRSELKAQTSVITDKYSLQKNTTRRSASAESQRRYRSHCLTPTHLEARVLAEA